MDEPIKDTNKRKPKLIIFFGLFVFVIFGLISGISYFQAIQISTSSQDSEHNTTSTLKQVLIGENWAKPVNDSIDLDFVEIDTISGEVNLEVWKFDMQPSLGVVVLFHDYRKTKSSLWNEALSFYRMGYTVLLVDFRNSGNSNGVNSTFGYEEAIDVKNVFLWCTQQYPYDKIYLYGMATGATAVLRAVSELNISPNGIIIQASFLNLKSYLISESKTNPSLLYPSLVSFWLTQIYNFNYNQLEAPLLAGQINTPTLLIHGMLDKQIEFEDTKQIFKALKGSKEIATFSKSGHESILLNEEANWVYLVTNFMQSHNQ